MSPFITNWFRGNPTERDDSPAPPVDIFVEELKEQDEQIEVEHLEPGATIPLEPIFVVIEYVDSRGRPSTRRITARALKHGARGALRQSVCHQRRAFRAFRCSRTMNVITVDGEVFEPARFFEEALFVSIDMREVPRSSSVIDETAGDPDDMRPGVRPRAVARHQIRMLAALSRADGKMRDEEGEAIIQFVARERDFRGIPISGDDRQALSTHIRRMRPTGDKIAESAEALFAPSSSQHMGRPALKRFWAATQAVAIAGAVLHPAEFDFIDGTRSLIEREPPS